MSRAKGDTDEQYRSKRAVITQRYRRSEGYRQKNVQGWFDRSIEERFWSKVDKDGPVPPHVPLLGPCWMWKAARTGPGYGVIRIEGRNERAHRWAWAQAHGPIPEGVEILHRCDNWPCVRESHLFEGTHADNMADMVSKGRWGDERRVPRGEDHWARAHPERVRRGEDTHLARLTKDSVQEIRRRYDAEARNGVALAKEFGVTQATISHIVTGKTWRHLLWEV